MFPYTFRLGFLQSPVAPDNRQMIPISSSCFPMEITPESPPVEAPLSRSLKPHDLHKPISLHSGRIVLVVWDTYLNRGPSRGVVMRCLINVSLKGVVVGDGSMYGTRVVTRQGDAVRRFGKRGCRRFDCIGPARADRRGSSCQSPRGLHTYQTSGHGRQNRKLGSLPLFTPCCSRHTKCNIEPGFCRSHASPPLFQEIHLARRGGFVSRSSGEGPISGGRGMDQRC